MYHGADNRVQDARVPSGKGRLLHIAGRAPGGLETRGGRSLVGVIKRIPGDRGRVIDSRKWIGMGTRSSPGVASRSHDVTRLDSFVAGSVQRGAHELVVVELERCGERRNRRFRG